MSGGGIVYGPSENSDSVPVWLADGHIETVPVPEPHPDDILVGPWGVKHAGEFTDPAYECSNPECGCHLRAAGSAQQENQQ